MRRKDREVTDISDILSIIQKCEVCRVAFSNNDIPYIVPLNFGYIYENNCLVLYFHCAKKGKKLDMLQNNKNVCFEFDCSHQVITGERAVNYTYEYESVIGLGRMQELTDYADKEKGLHILMKTYCEDKIFEFTQKELDGVAVLKLDVTEITGKRNIKR